MDFSTIFTLVPPPKVPSLADPLIFLPIWAFLFTVCLVTKLVTALWPSVLSYLYLVVAFAPDKNFVVAAMSWLSLLWLWKPWTAAIADLRREVDLAIDFAFHAWFLMAFPFIVLTIWVGLLEVLRLAANAIVRRIHDAMEFELDLDYVIKCYSPMQPGSPGDRAMVRLLADAGYPSFVLRLTRPDNGLSEAGYRAIFRDKRPRRFETKTSFEEQMQSRARVKQYVKERRAEIMARKEAERIAAEQLNDPKPTTFDSEPVPQSRETPTPVVQVSAWPIVPESDHVTEDVTTASGLIETEESLVGDEEDGEDSKAQEPAFTSVENGESLAQEPDTSVDDGESPLYVYIHSNAQEPATSVDDGESPLFRDTPLSDLPSATVPEAAQELPTSYEEERDGLLNIDAVQTEEPKVSFESAGEGSTEDQTSHEEEFDVEMADADPLEGLFVPGPFITSTCYSNPPEPILPLEVVAPWSPAGQEPGYHYDTRGYTSLSPVVEIADYQTLLEENEYANMDPDLLDRQMDDLLAGVTTQPDLAFTTEASFEEFEVWLDTLDVDAPPAAVPAANPLDEDEEMRDADWIPTPAFDSDNDSVTMEEPVSEFFDLGILRDSSIDEDMASVDLNGSESDPEVEFITAALAQLTLTLDVGNVIITEQQLSQEDVAMVELQGLIPPVIVVDMAEPEQLIPPTDNTTELNRPTPPVIEMAEPEEPIPPVDDIVPDAVPDTLQHEALPPQLPYMGDDDEDWNEQSAVSDGSTTRSTSPRGSEGGELLVVASPGPSLEDDMMAAFEERDLMAALLGMSPDRLSFSSRSRSTSLDSGDVPLWAFPPDMVNASESGAATNLSLNQLFDNSRTIEGNPTTESAADDLSAEDPASRDFGSGTDSVTEAQEPAPEDHHQAGSSESPEDDTTLAPGEVAEEQLPTTETPVPDNVPAILTTPEPNRVVQVEVAPIRMGGLILPGGNLFQPATPAPMTPLPQQANTPDPEAIRKQKEESLARDLRNVMRRRQPASIFHPKRPQKSSALIRSPDAAERESNLRSPQSFHALSRAGSDADGGADAVDEGAARVMLGSPAVMKAIRDSEARRGFMREGNADER
ncbi:uncharacterized protein Triagg1_1064 [Trichoderma aggressivum f. europaeum]|uniref:Uncharacterized protein n=1 Tax=Trichoderma aggressivum f. europaeum TaxID=173218 RepID=A0AAE1IKK9_9HYPO|nr:hypothetical protein Triagg1_1064 [Trichoderma aggressivum f. europaeum]